MKCIKCTEKNINSANYCKKCGYNFSDIERNAARRWSFVWFLEKIDKIKEIFDLSFITDHIVFKIISILVILGIGILNFLDKGVNLKILESSNYKVQYNTEIDEYYLITNNNQINLNLYIPNRTNNLALKHLDKENNIILEKNYQKAEEITLYTNGNDDYYILEAEYKDKTEELKLYMYLEDIGD